MLFKVRDVYLPLAICLLFGVNVGRGFTVDDELLALRRDLSTYVTMHGMRLDVIPVVTADSWKLEVHRIRNMKIFNSTLSTPTLLSHGFGCSSFDFMVNPRNESLAFILADRGYDVWAVNYRANKFSNQKIINGHDVKPGPKDYYRATWQYMAEYDVPAILNKIFEETQQDKVHLIGQSMGTTTLFAFLSENHSYDNKITTFVSIAPVIKFGNDTSCVVRSMITLAKTLAQITIWPFYESVFGARLLPSPKDGVNVISELLQSTACRLTPSACLIATNAFFQTKNLERLRANPHFKLNRAALYFYKFSPGVTVMNGYLFARQFNKKQWTKMDYDEMRLSGFTNIQEYNQTKPPVYNFTAVKVPLVIYYTANDVFTGVDTAKQVIAQLKLKPADYEIIEGIRLSHQDTLWAWDARCWIYDSVLARLDSLEENRGHLKNEYFRRIVPAHVKQLNLENGCKRK